MDPVDAGTDNGFAFTSPNWPTEPQGIIYRLTSSYPNHPASSFYYPTVKKLPTVASFQIIKVKEYELSEVFHHTEDTMNNEILKMEHISYVYEEGEGNTFVLKKNGSNAIGPAYQTALPSTTTTTTTTSTTQSPIDFNNEIEEEVLLTTQKPLINKADPVSSLDEAVVKNIVDVYGSHKKQIKTSNIETNEIAYAKKNSNKGHLHHKSGKGNKKDKDVRKIRKFTSSSLLKSFFITFAISRASEGLPSGRMVGMDALHQGLRHRRVHQVPQGDSPRQAGWKALSAHDGEEVVRLRSILQPALLQLVEKMNVKMT